MLWSLGHSATRLLGHSATRLLGYSVTRPPGYSVTRSLGHSATRTQENRGGRLRHPHSPSHEDRVCCWFSPCSECFFPVFLPPPCKFQFDLDVKRLDTFTVETRIARRKNKKYFGEQWLGIGRRIDRMKKCPVQRVGSHLICNIFSNYQAKRFHRRISNTFK